MKNLQAFWDKHFSFILAIPALLLEAYFLYIPLIFLFLYSIIKLPMQGRMPQFTLQHYKALMNYVFVGAMINSCLLAMATVLFCLLIGFTIAYFLAVKVKKFKILLLVLLILPSWTSFIVQVYAWFFLLERDGIISNLLHYSGIINQSFFLLHSTFATLLGMVYCYLPFMIFPLFAVLERMDKRLLQASADLGADRFQTFCRITVPMAKPGIVAGCFLVFVSAFAEFVIPELMGGLKKLYVGTIIASKFITYNDWQSAAAAVFLYLIFPLLIVIICMFCIKILKTQRIKKRSSNLFSTDQFVTHQLKKGDL